MRAIRLAVGLAIIILALFVGASLFSILRSLGPRPTPNPEVVAFWSTTRASALWFIVWGKFILFVVCVGMGTGLAVRVILSAFTLRVKDGFKPILVLPQFQLRPLGLTWLIVDNNEEGTQALAVGIGALHTGYDTRVSAAAAGRVAKALAEAGQPSPPAFPVFNPPAIETDPHALLPNNVMIYDVTPRRDRLELPVGINPQGDQVWLPLDSHVLIGGATQMGKTNMMAAWVYYIHRAWPSGDVQMVFIDTAKGVDIHLPDNTPSQWLPVATDDESGTYTIDMVYDEVNNRYKLMRENRVSSLSDLAAATGQPFRPIVVFVDEVWDFVRNPAAAEKLVSIGKKALQGGISLVLGTQRATNIPRDVRDMCVTRLAFPTAHPDEQKNIIGYRADHLPTDAKGRALLASSAAIIPVQTFNAATKQGLFRAHMEHMAQRGRNRLTGPRPAPVLAPVSPGLSPVSAPVSPSNSPGFWAVPGKKPPKPPKASRATLQRQWQWPPTPRNVEEILSAYQHSATYTHDGSPSISAVVRAIFGSKGGYWFQYVKSIIFSAQSLWSPIPPGVPLETYYEVMTNDDPLPSKPAAGGGSVEVEIDISTDAGRAAWEALDVPPAQIRGKGN